MAVPKFSGIGIVDLNGSIGNTCFARNEFGTYAKSKPPQPVNTPDLANWQAIVASGGPYWRTILTDAERQTWYDNKLPVKNAMARTIYITGYALFSYCNFNAYLSGNPVIFNSCPDFKEYPKQIGNAVITTLTNPSFIVTLTLNSYQDIEIAVTRELNNSVLSANQIYVHLLGGQFNAGVTPVYIGTLYDTRIGSRTPGHKIFVRVTPFAHSNGRKGIPFYTSAIVS